MAAMRATFSLWDLFLFIMGVGGVKVGGRDPSSKGSQQQRLLINWPRKKGGPENVGGRVVGACKQIPS